MRQQSRPGHPTPRHLLSSTGTDASSVQNHPSARARTLLNQSVCEVSRLYRPSSASRCLRSPGEEIVRAGRGSRLFLSPFARASLKAFTPPSFPTPRSLPVLHPHGRPRCRFSGASAGEAGDPSHRLFSWNSLLCFPQCVDRFDPGRPKEGWWVQLGNAQRGAKTFTIPSSLWLAQ